MNPFTTDNQPTVAALPSRTDSMREKGEASLAVYHKRLGGLTPADAPRRILFLVHGSSNSALSSFDLAVPGADAITQ